MAKPFTMADAAAMLLRMHNRWTGERLRRIKAEEEAALLREALHRVRNELLSGRLAVPAYVRAVQPTTPTTKQPAQQLTLV